MRQIGICTTLYLLYGSFMLLSIRFKVNQKCVLLFYL